MDAKYGNDNPYISAGKSYTYSTAISMRSFKASIPQAVKLRQLVRNAMVRPSKSFSPWFPPNNTALVFLQRNPGFVNHHVVLAEANKFTQMKTPITLSISWGNQQPYSETNHFMGKTSISWGNQQPCSETNHFMG